MVESVAPVAYDRSQVTTGIVHFGVGNFHRSHQARYIDDLLSNPNTYDDAKEWGICGVGVLPSDVRMRDALASRDNLYTLVERSARGDSRARQIGSIVEYLYAPEHLSAVIEKLAAPSTRVVSLTITEGGYNINDSTGQFDETSLEIVHDAANETRPSTVFGIITAGLRLRRSRGIPPFTVMSCDNIEGNGNVTRRSFVAFAALIDPGLAAWIETAVSFPNSMVDRITPVTSDDDRRWVQTTFGTDDPWPVVSEDFTQWVIEDSFTNGRPPLEAADVQIVDDVRPYELMKLRLLNASHQALAFTGLLSGYQLVHEAATDPVIARFVRAYMNDEATPTLEEVPGVDLDGYKDRLMERFANPYIRDTLTRLATDASDRIPKFVVPVIRDLTTRETPAPLSTFVVASWARYMELVTSAGDEPLADRQESAIRALTERLRTDPLAYVRNPAWFGELSAQDAFIDTYTTSLRRLRAVEVRQAVSATLDD